MFITGQFVTHLKYLIEVYYRDYGGIDYVFIQLPYSLQPKRLTLTTAFSLAALVCSVLLGCVIGSVREIRVVMGKARALFPITAFLGTSDSGCASSRTETPAISALCFSDTACGLGVIVHCFESLRCVPSIVQFLDSSDNFSTTFPYF